MPEIRIPIYGMVLLTDMEWEIINSPPFQRLRRIRQLAFSDLIYPGATHTRFEHSIGVMHLATVAFERISAKPEVKALLRQSGNYNDEMEKCALQILRCAALSHDLGHLPFSHAAENEVMGKKINGSAYTHEDYSHAYVQYYLKDILDNHADNAAFRISAEDVVGFLEGRTNNPRLAALAPWMGLVDGELDVDRMDYLRRDSYHLGVDYGRFDVQRVLSTLTMVEDESTGGTIQLGVEEGGVLAVESLILARYYMFHQVYFHKVRRFLDLQYGIAFSKWLMGNPFTPPTSRKNLEEHIKIDDWAMQAILNEQANDGEQEAARIVNRDCYKVVHEILTPEEEPKTAEAEKILQDAGIQYVLDDGAVKRTQKFDIANIFVKGETSFENLRPLVQQSKVAMQIPGTIFIKRLYASKENRDKIREMEFLQGVQ